MSETVLDVRDLPRPDAYATLRRHLWAILDGIDDEVAGMATFACVLHHGLGHLWTGFYRVVPPGERLRVGPYQGSLGCLDIVFGRGVCGTAAVRSETLVVADVSQFPGHISCDARARSEIVVPVIGPKGTLIAVLDIDSAHAGTFTVEDARGLESLVAWFREPGASASPGSR